MCIGHVGGVHHRVGLRYARASTPWLSVKEPLGSIILPFLFVKNLGIAIMTAINIIVMVKRGTVLCDKKCSACQLARRMVR
jgi:hypothetical protein